MCHDGLRVTDGDPFVVVRDAVTEVESLGDKVEEVVFDCRERDGIVRERVPPEIVADKLLGLVKESFDSVVDAVSLDERNEVTEMERGWVTIVLLIVMVAVSH